MYAQFEWMHVQVDQARRESFELRYVQGRLAQVLPKIAAQQNDGFWLGQFLNAAVGQKCMLFVQTFFLKN